MGCYPAWLPPQFPHQLPHLCLVKVDTWCMKCGLSWRSACKWGEGPSRAPEGATMTRGTEGSWGEKAGKSDAIFILTVLHVKFICSSPQAPMVGTMTISFIPM